MMMKPVRRFAEAPPKEPRDHMDFERFILVLDSGDLPPCKPRDPKVAENEAD